jgi:hypothetical protein
MKDAAGVVCGICFCLLFHSAIAVSADVLPSDGLPADVAVAYIVNEDSHPHRVSPGESARFSLEPAGHAGRMDVKCSLEADDEMILTGVTLRTQRLLIWPFPTRTIKLERKIDFDITAQTRAGFAGPLYFEFVNEDRLRTLWHQCYNN